MTTALRDPVDPWPMRPGLRTGSQSHVLIGEEGAGYDADVPNEFMIGMAQGYGSAPDDPQPPHPFSPCGQLVRSNHNQVVWHKHAAETMRERAHVGSAAWVDAPAQLGAFVDGSADDRRGQYASRQNDGGHYSRPNHATRRD